MSYQDNYTERVELDVNSLTEAQRIIVAGLLREGEFNTREAMIKVLSDEVTSYLDEIDYEPNLEWVDGVRYAIHLIKEMKAIHE